MSGRSAPWLLPFALLLAAPAWGAEPAATVCYDYGCQTETAVTFPPAVLAAAAAPLAGAGDGAAERAALGEVIGRLYRYAGTRTPIWRDKGGNTEDDGVEGRMDCIDHSTTTTHFLEMLAASGRLRFHTIQPRVMRSRFLVMDHWTAVLRDKASGELYAVDSWFGDNGDPAEVLPLADWRAGQDPEVIHRRLPGEPGQPLLQYSREMVEGDPVPPGPAPLKVATPAKAGAATKVGAAPGGLLPAALQAARAYLAAKQTQVKEKP